MTYIMELLNVQNQKIKKYAIEADIQQLPSKKNRKKKEKLHLWLVYANY